MSQNKSKAREYFNVLSARDNGAEDNKQLVPYHNMDNVIDVNQCLHACLKLWVEPQEDVKNKCHRVRAIHSGPRLLGRALKYNCTFIDVIEVDQGGRNDGQTIESLLESPEELVLFQLHHLPNRSISMAEHVSLFNWTRTNNRTQLILTHYRPYYLQDDQSDYRQCLKVCADAWLRVRMGDVSRTERCRTVLVGQSLKMRHQDQAGQKTLYQCAYFDLDKIDQMEQTKYDAKIFMVNKTNLRPDRALPSTINRPMLRSLENRSYVFYHTSHVTGALDCVHLCQHQGRARDQLETIPPSPVWKDHTCRIAVALPVTRFDPSFNANITEFACAFYDTNLNVQFTPKPSNGSREEERLVYQLEHQPDQVDENGTVPGKYFAELDGQSDLVGMTVRLYRPVQHVIILNNNNQTESDDEQEDNQFQNDPAPSVHRAPSPIVAQCLIECLRYNQQLAENQSLWQSLKERVDKTPRGDCSLVTITSGAIKDGRAVNFECQFYNFNLTRFKRTDLDNPNPLLAYQLNTTDLTALITTDYRSRFYQINETQTISKLITTQQSIRYVSGVNATKDCLKACFYTWPMSLVEDKQRRCRFVTVRPSAGVWTPQGTVQSYDCALYESGTTTRLHSLQVLVRTPKQSQDEDDEEEERIETELTSRGSEYKHLSSWPLAVPSDNVTQVLEPATIEDCQKECDNATISCKAVVALYQRNRLMECYLVDNQYRIDHNRTFDPVENIKVAVKINDLNRPFVQQEKIDRGESPYTALLDAVRRYEKNSAFVESRSR